MIRWKYHLKLLMMKIHMVLIEHVSSPCLNWLKLKNFVSNWNVILIKKEFQITTEEKKLF